MDKIVTFTWSRTVAVRDDFDPKNPDHVNNAREEAYRDVSCHDGELTDFQDEDLTESK